MAEEAEVDLVEIAPNAEPPVCRLMDYGKFKYQEQKRAAEAKSKQKIIQVKEVKFRPATDEGDYQVKLRNLKRFLDEGDKAKGDNKAEKAGKRVTKDIEYDDKKDKKDNKEEKVEETTVSGSVATATASGKSSKGGMSFGKGVYENYNKQFTQALNESIDVAKTIAEHQGEGKTITVTASGLEADMLMQLLKAAGLSGQSQDCGCGNTPCSCEAVDEAYGDTDETLNNPDWPTNTEKLDAEPNLRTYSGGLNGPKSTGQSTTVGGGIPNIQLRRQASMEESVALERSLFKTWKNYKG